MSKYLFITGGVLSSLGKGVTAASIGSLLEEMGYSISFLKLDPYLNVDPGTMNPYQHGEVFVTQDGAETDLDLGHYERFTNVTLKKHNSVTAGKLYLQLLNKERQGAFLGKTIQVVPHLTDAIKEAIAIASQEADCTIVEIGGTVGDIEGLPFIEAIRQMGLHAGRKDCVYIHLTYVPYLEASQELKTKPTQHAVKELRTLGIQPDILICRSPQVLSQKIKDKIALFTNVEEASVISAPDLKSIYTLPLHFNKEKLPERITTHLGLPYKAPNVEKWRQFTKAPSNESCITIAVVGKYVELQDAYKSLYEAIRHTQRVVDRKVEIARVDAEALTADTINQVLGVCDAIIVPGGFGDRGVNGKLLAINYARERGIPFLGICLGMQLAAIEFARSVLHLHDAHSKEFDPATKYPVIDEMEAQKAVTQKGGTMRLGVQSCVITPGSRAYAVYQQSIIEERHRHRYEFNAEYIPAFGEAGMIVSGMHDTQQLPEIIELPDHPFFIGCQFHPELQSKPFKPHPLFIELAKVACNRKL